MNDSPPTTAASPAASSTPVTRRAHRAPASRVTGLLSASLVFVRLQVRRILRSRRAWIGLLLLLGPVALVQFVSIAVGQMPHDEVLMHLGWYLQLQVVTPLLALLTGSAVVAEEVENRTITYVFTRPIPRPALFLGRAAATALVVGAALALATWVLAGRIRAATPVDGELMTAGLTGPLVAATAIGGAVYVVLFATLGTLSKYPMIIGAAYTFAIEGFLSNLPGSNREMTVQYWLRSLLTGSGGEEWAGVIGGIGGYAEPGDALVRLALITAVAAAIACWRIQRREFVSSA